MTKKYMEKWYFSMGISSKEISGTIIDTKEHTNIKMETFMKGNGLTT